MVLTLVGRTGVLDDIGRALDDGSGVLLTGTSGMGRTSVLRALQAQPDIDVVRVTAAPATAPVPLGALARFLPGEVSPAVTSGALGAVRSALGALAAAGTVLGFDDVHHLDGVSAALVADAAREGLRVVLTVREHAEVPPPLQGLHDEQLLREVALTPLGDVDAATLVRTVAGGRSTTMSVRWAVELGEGNPLLLAELARIAPRPGFERLPLTDRLRRAMAAHLEVVDDTTRRAVEVLAYDSPLPLGVLVDVVGAAAAEAVEQQALVTVGDGPVHLVSLAHPLLAEVVLADIGATRRAALASALLQVVPDAAARGWPDLPDGAVRHARWQMDAGDVVDLDIIAEASRHMLVRWDAAGAQRLAAVVHERRPKDCGAILLLAGAALLRGEPIEAERWFAMVEHLGGTPEQRLQARLGLAESAFFGRGDREAARVVLAPIGDPPALQDGTSEDCAGRDATTALAAMIALCGGDMAEAAVLAERVGPRATPDLRLVALAVRHVAVASAGHLDAAWRLTEQAIPLLADPAVAPEHHVRMWAGRRYLRLHLGDLQGVLDGPEDHRSHAALLLSNVVFDVGQSAAHLVMARGDLARSLVERIDVTLTETDPYGHRAFVGAVAAEIAAHQGRRDAAVAAARTARESHRPHLGWWAWAVPAAEGWALAATHRFPRACALMRRAAARAEASGDLLHQCLCLLAAVRLGGLDQAGALAEVAARVDGRLWPAVGVAARGLADPADPDGLLEDGCERLMDLGARLWAVDLLARGAALDRRSRRDGRAMQRRAAAEARAREFVDLTSPAVTALRGSAAAGLTPRQWQIATLAAEGWTSRQIADHLVLSVRTVDNHLARAYQVLGVHGRQDLADVLAGPPLGQDDQSVDPMITR